MEGLGNNGVADSLLCHLGKGYPCRFGQVLWQGKARDAENPGAKKAPASTCKGLIMAEHVAGIHGNTLEYRGESKADKLRRVSF